MKDAREKIMSDFHDSEWAGHKGIWASFSKIKERFWWPNMYKDIKHFVQSCDLCQKYSSIRHRDEIHLTYSPRVHFKWMVDLVNMPDGKDQEKYLSLAREDLTNYVEGRALKNKIVSVICKFLLEDVICRYRCVGQIIADRGDLDNEKARSFFRQHGV